MKLALVTQHYAPRFEGGTEAVVRAQARELARRGHGVTIVAGTDAPRGKHDVETAEVDGLAVRFVPRRPEERYDLTLERPRIEALVAELCAGSDVVHVHHWSTLCGTLVRRLSREGPTVVTLHDSFASCPRFFRVPVAPVERCPEGEGAEPPAPGELDLAPCVRCIASDAGGAPPAALAAGLRARAIGFQAELDAAERILVPSAAHGARLARILHLPPARLRVLHHGLARPFAPARCALSWDGREPLRIVSFGHRTPVKGLEDLVRALGQLAPERRARVELRLFGEEVEAGFDRRLAELAGVLPLRFEGPYDLDRLPARLEAAGGAHLAAFPSRVHESYGLVLDEAHALGLPAWVSDRGAPPERVGGAGRVLPAADPAAWRRAFDDLFDHPDTLAAERARVPAAPPTAADAARRLEALYAQLLEP